MSDEQGTQGEQRAARPTTASPTARWEWKSPCPHDYALGGRWGDDVSAERAAALRPLVDRQREWAARPAAERGDSVFGGVKLSGADVFWLAAYTLAGPEGDHAGAREQLRLRPVGTDLAGLHLEGAYLGAAHLEGAYLLGSHLEWAYLVRAHLEGAVLVGSHLEGAYLVDAHLEGAYLGYAHLEGAVLCAANFDAKTRLASVTLGETHSRLGRLLRRKPEWGNARLVDIRWEGPPDLTQVRWETLQRLGDEDGIGWRAPAVSRTERNHREVVRAYRQVAAQLRAQGLSEEADRFAERAQIRKRKQTFRQMLEDWHRPWRIPGDFLRWLFSWFLAVLAGYGYHPGRSVFWYLATIAGFAYAYYHLGPAAGHAFQPDGAVVFSLTSFHGRGFFPGGLDIESTVTKLAAIEAVIGLFIEISFIATFTQRFFGPK